MPRKDTLFEQFIAPIARLLINEAELRRVEQSIDWQAATARLSNPALTYPAYYSSQNFHGIKGGYLNTSAALTYDPVTQYALPPNETWVRQAAIDTIRTTPRRILDLGCGTGSMTLMLKQAFPDAEVIGLDLSPYMLAMAEYKANQVGLKIEWRHGKAEQTGFPDESFDLITVALLLHETPPAIAQAILQESYRLLKIGGEAIVLDGNQRTLRETEWITQIFEEPYVQSYAAESLDAWMGAAGFGAVQTQDVWWIEQVTRGVKPLPSKDAAADLLNWETGEHQWAMG